MRPQLALYGLILLSGCSQDEGESGSEAAIARVEPERSSPDTVSARAAPQNKFGFREELAQGPDPFGATAPSAHDLAKRAAPTAGQAAPAANEPPAQQQIAYSYGLGFQIASDRIAELQRAHTGLCEAMGPKCRIIRISQANADGFDGYGEVNLQVASTEAGNLEASLVEPAEKLGGELVSSVRDGEDLTENIIDSEARLKSRLLLREKLTAILQSNRGSVAELIEAEKAVADVNAEIDEARNTLEEFRNRIRYSDVQIKYEPYFGQTQLGFSRPVITAFRSIGTTFGMSIAALIYLVTALVPVIALILALRWVLHRFGWRLRFWRKAREEPVAGLVQD